MMLGDVLAAARGSGADIEKWLEPADPALWRALRSEAMQHYGDPADFARMAVADFSEHAGEEDWAMLVSKMRDADDPGRVLLLTMMRWRLGVAQGGAASAVKEDARDERSS
jgi:hypothetical protein